MTTNNETKVDTNVVTALSEDMLARCGSVFRELLTIYNATGDVAIGTKLLPASKLEEAFVEGSSVSTIMGGRTWKKDSAYLGVFLRAYADEGCHGVRYHENGRSSGFYFDRFGLPVSATTKKTKASGLSDDVIAHMNGILSDISDPDWDGNLSVLLRRFMPDTMPYADCRSLVLAVKEAINSGVIGTKGKWVARGEKVRRNVDWKEPVAPVPVVAPSVAA
jgi:hypothetical protein